MMKKPNEMTPQGFANLLESALAEHGYSNARDAAYAAQVSPDVMSDIRALRFPKKLGSHASQEHRRKVEHGAVFSLTRICDTFGFDLDVCLQALSLPKDER